MTMQLPVAEKVLIAPLNWGLGHASRCVPIINGYLKQGAQVHIASNGKALNYLKHRYPQLKSYDLGGSEVNYKGSFLLSILRNVPKLLSQIRNERKCK